ncbi:MAG TPA: LppX_LprAFG lipoprotein [Thermopolyspora sp.]|jgi:Protein of unknown function (DUF1396).
MTPAFLAAGAAALIALTGCGSSASQSLGNVKLTAAEALQHSASQAQSITSYTADLVVDIIGSGREPGKVQGTVVVQQKPKPAGDFNLSQVSFNGQTLPGGLRAILQDDTAYLKLDALKPLTGSHKPWVKFDLNKVDTKSGLDVKKLLSEAQQVDLRSSAQLLAASKDAKAVGHETIGGVETTHYTGTFRVAEAAKQLTPELRQQVQDRLSGVKDMKFDAWIDADNLPRKIVMTGAANKVKVTMTTQLTSYNKPVDISAPPADQIGELSTARAGHH